MRKHWFVVVYVTDEGGPESGPMISTSEFFFKSKSLEKAKERVEHLWEDEKNTADGYFVSEITDDYKNLLESWKRFNKLDWDELAKETFGF